MRMPDVLGEFAPAFVTALNDRVASDPDGATSKQLLQIFDTGGCTKSDGTQAKPRDGVIDLCEFLSNSIVKNVLLPDVQLFDAQGRFAPNPANTMRDSLSAAFGFAAVSAQF
jgi:hypothetical protein